MGETCREEEMAAVITELCNLRTEHMEASQDIKTSLSRVESTLSDVIERTAKLEQQVTNVKQRVSDVEDKTHRHESFAIYFKEKQNYRPSVKTWNPELF